MKPAGAALYGVGVVLFIAFVIWGAAGVYTSQLVPYFMLCAAAIVAVVIGAKLNKDPNPNKAVEWKPSVTATTTVAPSLAQMASAAGQDSGNDTEAQNEVDTGEMMNCPQCGNPTRVGAGFCGSCGSKLEATPPLSPPPPPPPAPSPEPVVAPAVAPALASPPPSQLTPPPSPTSTAEQDRPEVAQPVASGMITPPPGMITPPPGMAVRVDSVAEAPARQVSDVVFVTSPGIPFVSPPSEDLDATRASVRRRTGSPWRLVLPDGSNVIVDGTLLVGRGAAANGAWPGAQLLSVDDTTNSVSKTHAAIQSDEQGLWVTDLQSTNGVVVTQPDGTEVEVEGDERVRVDAGCDIELGDFIIQVEKD